MSIVMRVTFLFLLAALPSAATLVAGSLKPAGGEAFKPGDVMTIEWTASKADNGKYDIYLSKDGGKTWPTEFAEGWQGSTVDNAKNAYRWTIPAGTNTTLARIRVCQLSGGHCVQPNVYTLASGDFTISPTASVPEARTFAPPRFDFRPEAAVLEAEFQLAEGAEVSLRAYDTEGRLVAETPAGRLESGKHRLSLSSGRLAGSGPFLFRLQQGSNSTTWTWPNTSP